MCFATAPSDGKHNSARISSPRSRSRGGRRTRSGLRARRRASRARARTRPSRGACHEPRRPLDRHGRAPSRRGHLRRRRLRLVLVLPRRDLDRLDRPRSSSQMAVKMTAAVTVWTAVYRWGLFGRPWQWPGQRAMVPFPNRCKTVQHCQLQDHQNPGSTSGTILTASKNSLPELLNTMKTTE